MDQSWLRGGRKHQQGVEMKVSEIDISTSNSITEGQRVALYREIAAQTGIPDISKAVRAFKRGDFILQKVPVLEWIGNVTIPPFYGKFYPSRVFKLIRENGIFGSISQDFKLDFLLEDQESVERVTPQHSLRYAEVLHTPFCGKIDDEIGSVHQNCVFLRDIMYLVKRHSEGFTDLLEGMNVFWVSLGGESVGTVCLEWWNPVPEHTPYWNLHYQRGKLMLGELPKHGRIFARHTSEF
jgi:hypothetical protein